ncbi:copper chaperone PCu(A)C [Streptomyces sp. SP2-10]|uniref:copper chaperone PCu(A)C n=1 Tax=Streptomyces sp. SP2-10 TaxID=2873385 RepID=UPI001CA6EF4C|nr:copper chaperone PCu(A)C [Streptomyces sp. SP2-10]MBY8846564.1 copper chaperone PCu(A)C [Streptomyces sp. SP2-10]
MKDTLTRPSARLARRRQLTDTLLAVLVPVAASSLALAGLTTWVGTGRAGSPARIRVTEGRVLLPGNGSSETAAFFRITNEGGSADRLVGVTSPRAPGGVGLARHRMGSGATAYRAPVESVEIPAGGSLTMSPYGVDLTVAAPAGEWRAGDLVSFTLEFGRSGRVTLPAVVVRPGTVTF